MKCTYDLEFVFLYSDNLLSDEEAKKFEVHLETCSKCKNVLQQDKCVTGFLKKELEGESLILNKNKILNGIPMGMYKKNPSKYRILSLVRKALPNTKVLVSAAAVLLIASVLLTNLDIFSSIVKTASTFVYNKQEIGKVQNNEELNKKLTDEKPYSKALVQKGSKSILFVAGGKSSVPYDNIGVINISKDNKIKLISITGDLYINYVYSSSKNISYLPDSSISFLSCIIKEKFDIDVENYIKFDSKGFGEIVDLFGGVTIDVPYDMHYDDPVQGISVHINKGKQRLNGNQVEVYMEYRNSSSKNGPREIERSKNHLALIKAFLEQKGTEENIDKLDQYADTLDKYIEHSFDANSLAYYKSKAKDIAASKNEIESIVVGSKGQEIDGTNYIVVE